MSLPPGWYSDLLHRADLDASFVALLGHDCGQSELMRGRIRSLQMRPSAAQAHFVRAAQVISTAAEDIPTVCLRFIVQAYTLENALVLEPPTRDAEVPPASRFNVPGNVLDEYPELRQALALYQWVRGIAFLNAGDARAAERVLSDLVGASDRSDSGALHRIALACAQLNRGRRKACDETLASAIERLTSEPLLVQVHAASVLRAFGRYLRDDSIASRWERELRSLPIPDDTRAAFVARSDLILGRSGDESGLMVL